MTFPTIEFQGYSKTERDVKLGKMFSSAQLHLMNEYLGKSIFFNHLFAEICKAKPEPETFSNLI
jgi:hypothetical protein